jgi:hypothetical protein
MNGPPEESFPAASEAAACVQEIKRKAGLAEVEDIPSVFPTWLNRPYSLFQDLQNLPIRRGFVDIDGGIARSNPR